jgi:uncharacterized protein
MTVQEKVRIYVKSECDKPDSCYGREPYEFHYVPMVRYALELSDKLGGNREVIEIAGWLHDIGAIVSGRESHHETGAKIAVEKLREFGYPDDKTELVRKCIYNHRGSMNNARETLEEKIVAEADVLSNFDNIPGIFKAAFVFENQTQGEAKTSTLKKLTNKYNQLSFDESKTLIKPKYEAVKLLLG